ncbi:hypothetical protein, partial [Pseudomonas aeruginosa]|uniref:hypothetical protein n=1 Tax=Pseudomonas aeruginosa TaxID=287 RepID=UPI0015C75A44
MDNDEQMEQAMREEFEAWATKHRMPIHRDGVVTDYAARCTDECWQAWKASRAALRVVLPKSYAALEYAPKTKVFNIIDMEIALQQAG